MYGRHWLSLFGYFISAAASRGNAILFCLSVESGVVMVRGMHRTWLCYPVENGVVRYLL